MTPAFAQRTCLLAVMMAHAFSGHNIKRPMPQGVPGCAAFITEYVLSLDPDFNFGEERSV